MYVATRYHDFCAGHRVYGHENKCSHLHGHNYRVYFHIRPKADLDEVGRVIDFSVIKSKLCQWLEDNWDHKMLLWEKDIQFIDAIELIDSVGLCVVPFNPTAENMAHYLVETIAPERLKDSNVELYKCTIEETRKCSATYQMED